MAAIVNDRDLLLQAAASRLVQVPLPDNVIVPGLANIRIVGNANFFTLDANGGPASPASITMTLVMTAVVGVVTWSVIVGSATLTGSGLSRTITAATGGMGTNFVTVRASVTYNGITYTADYSISVVTNGSSGVRGVVHLYGTAAFWSDTAANNLILSLTGSATKQWGDTVTFSNDAGFASTRFWNTNTATWIVVERTIDGSMLVQGAIYAGSGIIGALAVTSAHIAASLESDNWSSSGGTDGWLILKDGRAWFQDVVVRGDILADQIVANTIVTAHVQGNGQITDCLIATASPAQSATTVALTVTLPAGDQALRVQLDPGTSYTDATLGKDGGGGTYSLNYAWITYTYNGGSAITVHAASYILVDPAAGTYVFTGHRVITGSNSTVMYLMANIFRR